MSFSKPSVPKPIPPTPPTVMPTSQPTASPLGMNFNINQPMRPMPFATQRRAGRRSLIGGSQ